jgi:hypothetical protein
MDVGAVAIKVAATRGDFRLLRDNCGRLLDEIISKLVARLQGLEYGDKYVVLHGLTPTHEENITVALERKKLAVLVGRPDGSWRLLGSLNRYLNEVLQFVMQQKEIAARDLAA